MATKQRASQCACAALLLAPNIPVFAHIKWFAECNVADAPRPIGQVLNGTFVKGLLISIFAIYFFFLADRYIYKKGYWSRLDQRLRRLDAFAVRLMRVGAAVFFLSLGL